MRACFSLCVNQSGPKDVRFPGLTSAPVILLQDILQVLPEPLSRMGGSLGHPVPEVGVLFLDLLHPGGSGHGPLGDAVVGTNKEAVPIAQSSELRQVSNGF